MPFSLRFRPNASQITGHATRQMAALKLGDSGNAAAEYAVLLALIVGVLLLGSRFLGRASEKSLSAVASTLGGADAPAHYPAASAPANQQGTHAATTRAASDHDWVGVRLLVAEIIAIAALGGLWYYMRICRRQRVQELADELPASIRKAIPHNRLYAKRQEIYRVLTNNMSALFASRMQVAHVMSKQVTRVSQETSTDEIRTKMAEKQFRHLLVCATDGRLEGIISDRDLAERQGATAGAIMTAELLTVSPSTHVNLAVTLMLENRISCLPVVSEEGRTVGVLTSTDLMMTLQCALQLLQRVAAEVDEGEQALPAEASSAPGEWEMDPATEETQESQLIATR